MAHEVTFIPGDGTGPELAEATRRVLEATGVEFTWDEQPAGRRRVRGGGQSLPRPHAGLDQAHGRRHQGPDHDAGGLGLPLGQRASAQGARPVRVHPALQGLRGRAHALSRDGHRHRAREHRGPLRGDRVRARHGGGREAEPLPRRRARLARARARRHLHQADHGVRLGPDRRGRLRLRGAERAPQGDGGAQGEHHEVLRRPLPRDRAQGRRAPSGRRVRGPHHRQPVQPARLPPGGVRRDRAAQPLRGHRVRPRGGDDRRPRAGAGRQPRHGGGGVRGHPRLRAEVQGAEQGQPDGADAVGRAHAPPPRRARCGRPA